LIGNPLITRLVDRTDLSFAFRHCHMLLTVV
jgi:hypothetical protein